MWQWMGMRPLSVGEPFGNNPAWLDRAGVKALFETALRSETGADRAYYNESSVVGRLRRGLIRSGDISESADSVQLRNLKITFSICRLDK